MADTSCPFHSNCRGSFASFSRVRSNSMRSNSARPSVGVHHPIGRPAHPSDDVGHVLRAQHLRQILGHERHAHGDEEFDVLAQDGLFLAESDVSRFWTDDNKFGYVNKVGKVVWGPIGDSPDHPPLFGWTSEANSKSCEGIPETVRQKISTFTKD